MNTTSDTVSFSSRGQIVIPRRLRKRFGIEKGTKALIESDDEAIILRPITREYIEKQFGKYRGKNLLKALTDEKKLERER